jgi:putative MATE family efflux protein
MDISQSRRITEGVIWKQILLFFFPILAGSFFQQMYNTVDTIIVGRFVGTGALAAVGASGPILTLIYGFFLGLSSGATVILSQFFGAGDREGVSRALHTGIALALILGSFVGILGYFLAPWMLAVIGTPESCMRDAILYCRILFLSSLFSMVYNMGSGILRAMGDSRRPMVFLMVCCVVNIVADLLFVWVFRMGVVGAALATALAQAVSSILVVLSLVKPESDTQLHWGQLRLHRNLLVSILRIGVPSGIQLLMFDVSNLIVQASINSFGEAAVAAWVAFGKADGITWMISSAFSVAVTTFVGQNFGARKYDRVRKSVWVCMGLSAGLIGGLSVLEFIFREPLLRLFTTDPQVVSIGAVMMASIVLYNVLFIPTSIFSGAMQGTGYSLPPSIIMCIFVCGFRAVWVLVAVAKVHTVEMLCLAYPISWAVCAVIFTGMYFQGGWLNGRIKALGMDTETT